MTRARRAKGEASISIRKDGRWMARVDLGWQDGRRRSKVLYGRTEKEVREKLRSALRAHEEATLRAGPSETLDRFLGRWLETAKDTVRPATYRTYEYVVRVHLKPGLGRERFDRLTPADVEEFLQRRRRAGLSPRSVHHLRAVLRTALGKAERWDLLNKNPAPLADGPKVETYAYTVLDPEQAQRFLRSLDGDPLEALCTVPLPLGLRQGEALGLTWASVDYNAGVIRITHGLQQIGGKRVLVPLKTERSRRTLTMPTAVGLALRKHERLQRRRRRLAGTRWVDTGLVFTTATGTPLEGTSVTKRFQERLSKAGLPRMKFHELRHSAASLLIAQGVPLRTVMDVLGHSTVTLTANTYGHLYDEARQEAARAMDRALGQLGS